MKNMGKKKNAIIDVVEMIKSMPCWMMILEAIEEKEEDEKNLNFVGCGISKYMINSYS